MTLKKPYHDMIGRFIGHRGVGGRAKRTELSLLLVRLLSGTLTWA